MSFGLILITLSCFSCYITILYIYQIIFCLFENDFIDIFVFIVTGGLHMDRACDWEGVRRGHRGPSHLCRRPPHSSQRRRRQGMLYTTHFRQINLFSQRSVWSWMKLNWAEAYCLIWITVIIFITFLNGTILLFYFPLHSIKRLFKILLIICNRYW